jgi:hypothetical protein
MSIKYIISGNEVEDEEVSQLIFNVSPSCGDTVYSISKGDKSYLILDSESDEVFIDKRSIDNLISALQEAKRLWGDK